METTYAIFEMALHVSFGEENDFIDRVSEEQVLRPGGPLHANHNTADRRRRLQVPLSRGFELCIRSSTGG